MCFNVLNMTRNEAISEAKRQVRKQEGSSMYAILCNDGAYMVASRKPMLSNTNGKHDVIRCDWDGMTYPD